MTVRYQMCAVHRQEEAIVAHGETLGWRAYVTNAPAAQLTLAQAVLAYRDEWLIERGFHRLKGAPLSLDPLFVKRDDQVTGLINLLSIAVRMLTLLEFVVRRQLKQNQEQLTGLIPNNPHKAIDNPTTERLLNAFDNISDHRPFARPGHPPRNPADYPADPHLGSARTVSYRLHPSGGIRIRPLQSQRMDSRMASRLFH